jgi:hypothetical protein
MSTLNRDSDSHQHQVVCKREVRAPWSRIAPALGPGTATGSASPAEAGDRELADDDGPIFSTVAKLVDALQRAFPHSRDLELREEPLRLGRELLRGTKYEGER